MDNPYSKNAKVNSPIYDINGIDINNRIYVTERDIFPTLRNEELGRTYFILEITYQELYNLAIETGIDSIAPNAHDKKVRIPIKGNQEELEMNKALILKSKEDQKSELKSEENYHLIISDETHEKFDYKYYIEKDSTINEYQKKFPYEPKSLTFDE
ncbi:hypothetical protein H8356DRAFT_961138 [Neocallimastix lanati (nom. inval.)]|uniref:Uncharacterized protein n=1 Tax=Neocallimastix californiae TaxID=1754190 RepID=A0A1Y1YVI9_9FUNG|nr:hypothetical protein H8356DRAFT_1385134 [Neocallimastix sp. JGI-2020a]KAG4087119.1 hypothetical protein H8356DRAFT_961138 [Neocallimastix sp. JGI-2020a]ORY00192.1 hypothetical protein LY90DRAFT_519836 [Neocallimastix californiae]ORY01966.1 hypothetical protein LY90DRAFT_519684 [Neocallimastix californiae]|eukprot:ORY00192.1 hypothetical protein LY90DRAFT_519836 [Neocallimastix californiae]